MQTEGFFDLQALHTCNKVQKCEWGSVWKKLPGDLLLTIAAKDVWSKPTWWRYQGEEIVCLH